MPQPEDLYARIGFDPRKAYEIPDGFNDEPSPHDPSEEDGAESGPSEPSLRDRVTDWASENLRFVIVAATVLLIAVALYAAESWRGASPASVDAQLRSPAFELPYTSDIPLRPLPLPFLAGTEDRQLDPFLRWEREAESAQGLQYYLAALGPLVPVGMTVDIKGSTPSRPSLLVKGLELLRIPAATIDIRHAGSGFALSLANFTVGKDGVLMNASPNFDRAIIVGMLVVLAFGAAAAVRWTIEQNPYSRFSPELTHGAVLLLCVIVLVAFGAISKAGLLLLPFCWMRSHAARRLAAVVFGLSCCWVAANIPIEPPHAALSAFYGSLGVNTVDIAWLGAVGLVALAWGLVRIPNRSTSVHVSLPLVQDVRIVNAI